MTTQRHPDLVLAAWLDEGPTDLPDATRRAIVAALPTTPQARRGLFAPGRTFQMSLLSRSAVAAVLFVAVLGGTTWYLTAGPGGQPPTSAPTPPPSQPSTPSTPATPVPGMPAMTTEFTSPSYGYSLRYPAGWTAVPATAAFDPAAAEDAQFDVFRPATGGWLLRVGSVQVPASGAQFFMWSTYAGCDATCQQAELSDIVIDGQSGKVRDPYELQAIAIVGDRAYVFTLYPDPEGEDDVLPYLEAFLGTVDLRPEDAAVPSAAPN